MRDLPRFQELEQVKGTMELVEARLKELVAAKKDIWVDARITEGEGDLAEFWNRMAALAVGSKVRLMRRSDVRPRKADGLAGAAEGGASLKEMMPEAVFEMRLQREHLTEEDLGLYRAMFEEVYRGMAETDANKE